MVQMCSCQRFLGQRWSLPGWGKSQSRISKRKPQWEERLWSWCSGNSWGPHVTFSKEVEESLLPNTLPASSSYRIFPLPIPPSLIMISELSLQATERGLCSSSLDHIVYGA